MKKKNKINYTAILEILTISLKSGIVNSTKNFYSINYAISADKNGNYPMSMEILFYMLTLGIVLLLILMELSIIILFWINMILKKLGKQYLKGQLMTIILL